MPDRIEIESLAELRLFLGQSSDLTGATFQGIDFTGLEHQLAGVIFRDNLLLGCTVPPEVLCLFEAPLVFPELSALPFNPYRASLYSPEELLGAYQIGRPESYQETLDYLCYRQYLDERKDEATDARVTLARRLHDHAIGDAMQEFARGRKIVAIMGGHSLGRDEPMYLEIARLSRALVHAGFLPASGGGPGAMEATHLGAWFAERPDSELEEAVAMLSGAPKYSPIGPWLEAAFAVAAKYPVTSRSRCASLGIPTWLYGHEPPSCFALHIAKYFANSVREDGLLAIAHYGVVFSPGSAGTIQEIFQDATQNHYKTQGMVSPMIFLGKDYWTQTKPVYPLLQQLAAGHDYERYLGIEDERGAILDHIKAYAETRDGIW